MRRYLTLSLLGSVVVASAVAAQATGMPSFNAPYRAFTRSEIGLVISFPNGGGTAFEGAYRKASGKFDIGFRGGILDPGGAGSTLLLLGVEARERVLSHTVDFPLDGALVSRMCNRPARSSRAAGIPISCSHSGWEPISGFHPGLTPG